MAKRWEPQSREVYQQWIDDIEDEASDKLTEWETNFIASINTQLTYRDLTQPQAETLEKIYVKYTS
jgi:hypothetical protein